MEPVYDILGVSAETTHVIGLVHDNHVTNSLTVSYRALSPLTPHTIM